MTEKFTLGIDIASEQFFLREKLALRGFPNCVFHDRLRRFEEPKLLRVHDSDARVIPFKLPFGRSVLDLNPVGAIRKHVWMLGDIEV